MYPRDDDRGQVESVGTALFLGVVVLSMSTFGVFYVANASSAADAQGPGADTGTVRVDVSADRLTVRHNGGAPIPVDELSVAVRNDSGEIEHAVTPAAVRGDGDDLFEAGESWRLDRDRTADEEVTVLVENEREETVLYRESLTVPAAGADESNVNRALGGPTDETPAGNEDPGFAYEDIDGDGAYTGSDTKVTKYDLSDGYDAGDASLVVPDSVGELRTRENEQVAYRGSSVDIESSLLSAKNLHVTATGGDVSLVGMNLTATGGGGGNGRLVVSAPNGSVDATNASLYADKEITLSARDHVILERGTLDGPTGGNGVTASAEVETGDVVVTDARFLGGADPLDVTPDGAATGEPERGTVV